MCRESDNAGTEPEVFPTPHYKPAPLPGEFLRLQRHTLQRAMLLKATTIGTITIQVHSSCPTSMAEPIHTSTAC